MLILIAGLVIFFAVHSVRMAAPEWRQAQIAANEGRWKALYSVASLIGFILIVWGWIAYRAAAPVIYEPPTALRPVTDILVLLAFIAFPASYAPAIHVRRWTGGHPMLTGMILWSLGHLLLNGDLASILLFGAFLIYSVVNRIAAAGRPVPAIAGEGWRGDLTVAGIAIVIYLVFALWVHGWLFGVSPFA